ncbi:hypothetical protein PENSPDRAFT_678904 [Peniophora sp. CONT]|nr:hypothetical protein PENSPDRAFT_678904 [Peniophora sp. CONT]
MIKKRSRPQTAARTREDDEAVTLAEGSLTPDPEEAHLSVHEIVELRRLRRQREGIDATKLVTGDVKKRRKREPDEGEPGVAYGLNPGVRPVEEEGDDASGKDAKARRSVRRDNFTQQTNALDVDKHMMAYIEENMKKRRLGETSVEAAAGTSQSAAEAAGQPDTQRKAVEEGNVTNSVSMLTAIPEVDLGMDARLKNIEETEKAKQEMAHERRERKRVVPSDEQHLVDQRFYQPNMRMKSDTDIIRDAKREAMGLPPQEDEEYRPRNQRGQVATDDLVMERFKKRMRK